MWGNSSEDFVGDPGLWLLVGLDEKPLWIRSLCNKDLRGRPIEEDSDELIAAVGEGSGFLEHDMDLGLGHSLDGFAGTHVDDELLIVCAHYYVYLNHVYILKVLVGKLSPRVQRVLIVHIPEQIPHTA